MIGMHKRCKRVPSRPGTNEGKSAEATTARRTGGGALVTCSTLRCIPLAWSSLRRRGRRSLVVAFLVRARDHRAGFQVLLHQELMSAARTFLRDRLVGRSEFALRIIRAAVERVALARLLLDQLAVFTQRAFHADEVLLHEFAIGISGARREFAVTSMADHQIASALRTRLVERDIRNAFALIEPSCRLAIRITRASHELSEAPALKDHHAPAVLAVLLLRRLLHIGGVEIGQVDRIFFREGAAFRIFLVVRAASVERPVLAPLDHER